MRPPYDRSGITAGIVHIGVGNFHRSHQAMYVDRLLADDPQSPWGICGVGMLPGDAVVRDALLAQNGLYSLVLKHPSGELEHQVIGSIIEVLLAPEDPWAVVARMADPAIRIVSLTITEGGYNTDDATGEFVRTTPAVVADAVPGATPTTVFAVVCHALARRREAGVPPFTVVSCDNVEGNGTIARGAFLAFAELLDPDLAAWMREQVRFPSSMVDRITPATTDADRSLVKRQWGVADLVPVTAEPFTQWVLEDHFTDERPELEAAGVQFVTDVRPYELMKLRLLNASHQAMAYVGILLGYEHVHEAAADTGIIALLKGYAAEAVPTLEPVPGVDLIAYQATLLERFSNPAILDTVARLAAFPSDRIPKFLLPVVRANLAADRPIQLSSLVVASWLRYTEVHPDRVVDPRWHGEAPEGFLNDRDVFGDLVQSGAFQTSVLGWLEKLRLDGPRAALDQVT